MRAPRARLLAAAVVTTATLGGGCGGDGSTGAGARRDDAGRNQRAPASAAPLVVSVAVGSGPSPAGAATGFAAGRGRVVTVAHVLRDRAAVRVTLPAAGPRRARVLRVDPRLDLALLAVPGVRAAPVVPARSDGAVRVLVRRDGTPRAVRAAIRRHITARVRATPREAPAVRPAVELGAAVDPGDSGAPVVDARGRIAAVVFAASRDRPGTAYATDAPALAAFLRAR